MTNVKRNYNKSGNTILSFTDKVGKKIELVLQGYSLKLKIDGKYKNTIVDNISLEASQDELETSLKDYTDTTVSDYIQSNASVKTIIALTQVEYDALDVKDATTLYFIKQA